MRGVFSNEVSKSLVFIVQRLESLCVLSTALLCLTFIKKYHNFSFTDELCSCTIGYLHVDTPFLIKAY